MSCFDVAGEQRDEACESKPEAPEPACAPCGEEPSAVDALAASMVICEVLDDPFASSPLQEDATAEEREDEVVMSAREHEDAGAPRQSSLIRPLPPLPPLSVPPPKDEAMASLRPRASARPLSAPPALHPLREGQPPLPVYRGAMKRSLPPPHALVMPSAPPSLPALRAISTLPPAPSRSSTRPPSTMRPPPSRASMRSAPAGEDVFFVPPYIARPSQPPPSSVFEEIEAAPPSALLREVSLSELRRMPVDLAPAPAVTVEATKSWSMKTSLGLVLLGMVAGASLTMLHQRGGQLDEAGAASCEMPAPVFAAAQPMVSEEPHDTSLTATSTPASEPASAPLPESKPPVSEVAPAIKQETAVPIVAVAKADGAAHKAGVIVTVSTPLAERALSPAPAQPSAPSAHHVIVGGKELEMRRSERDGEVELVIPQPEQAISKSEGAAKTEEPDARASDAAAEGASEAPKEPALTQIHSRELSDIAAPAPPAMAAVPIDLQRAREVMSHAAAAAAAACGQGQPGVARVSVTFAPSGRSTGVGVQANAFAGTTVGSCIATHFKGLSVDPFEGQPRSVSISVHIR